MQGETRAQKKILLISIPVLKPIKIITFNIFTLSQRDDALAAKHRVLIPCDVQQLFYS